MPGRALPDEGRYHYADPARVPGEPGTREATRSIFDGDQNGRERHNNFMTGDDDR